MGRGKPSDGQEASKPRPRTANNPPNASEHDSEAEEGRSSLGKPKRRKVVAGEGKVNEDRSDFGTMEDKEGTDEGTDENADKTVSPLPAREETKKASKGVRFGTYLDVHKAEKARKKKKKKS